MKIAITIWNDRVAPVCDVAGQAVIIDDDPAHRDSVSLARLPFDEKILRLREQGVKTLICGAISGQARDLAESFGMEVRGFIAGEIEAVIAAWRCDRLAGTDFAMPGCGRRRRCCRARTGLK